MPSAEEFIDDFLKHEYDPVKAREYYLRTRQLKGRRAATPFANPGRTPANSATTKDQPLPSGPKPNEPKTKTQAERVAAVQRRLDRLKAALALLVEQAKARSGVESDPEPTKKSATSKETAPEKPKSTQEKKEAADKAREARQKENPQSLTAQEQSLRAEVKQVQEQIAQARAKLQAAVERAKRKQPKSFQSSAENSTNSSTPPKGR